jgi:lysophospholipase L1-like esterase
MPWNPNPRSDERWMNRHLALKEEIAHAKPNILFIGDSITARWKNAGKRFWDSTFAPLNAFNAGIEGETTQDVLWRLNQGEFSGASPSTVVIMIGTNNINSSGGQSVARGVKALADAFKHEFSSARIIVLSILPRDNANSVHRMKLVQANEVLKRGASSSRYYFCDVGQFLIEDNGDLFAAAFLDKAHLREDGYGRIAAEIARAISGTSRTCSPPLP